MKVMKAFVLTVLCTCMFMQQTAEAQDMDNTKAPSGPFAQGDLLQNSNFSGRVWLKMLVDNNTPFNCPIGNVTFEPGCRNSWHKHPGGQILLVTNGLGLFQERGKPAQVLHAGDVITIAPLVEHWHGATPDAWFTHLAISTNPQTGESQWLEPVTQQDYDAAARVAKK